MNVNCILGGMMGSLVGCVEMVSVGLFLAPGMCTILK